MKKQFQNKIRNPKFISYSMIVFVSIFLCIPLFSKHMDIARDDGIQHICRLIGTYQSLEKGDTAGVILSNFCNGFGYSWNLFYSPLTAYVPLIFHFFTSSFVLCLKLFLLATMALSGVFLFQLVYNMTRSYKAGVISAILYMSAPYHMTDLYNRIAVAELASFVFLPVVFKGLYQLFYRKDHNPIDIIIGATGLLLSHNVMTVFTAFFAFGYIIYHYRKMLTKKRIVKLLFCVIAILLCSSFYWIPLLEHCMATDYEVFLPNRMYKNNTLTGSKLTLLDLFITRPHDMNFHIGIGILIGLFLLFCYRKKIPSRIQKTLTAFTIFGSISLFMTLFIFPWEHMPDFLKMIQFAWRMMEFVNFFFSILAGIGYAYFLHHHPKRELTIVVLLVLTTFVITITEKTSITVPFDEKNYITPVRSDSSYW